MPAKNRIEAGFSHNPFMMGYDNRIFQEDAELGFVFPEQKLISQNKFVKFEDIVNGIYSNKLIVLNMGDSSTSGWNSERISKKVKNPYSAFFSYKTYSDFLQSSGKCFVINAGIPGYTSLQGKLYLRRLLKKFFSDSVHVDYATLYFGNNDSTYNAVEDKVKLERKMPSPKNRIGYRVSPDDYEKNMSEMIEICIEYGVRPVLIMPLVNEEWEPGIRSIRFRDEFSISLERMPACKAKEDLLNAIQLHKQKKYHGAKELDYVLPRIKDAYIKKLEKVARRMRVPLVSFKKEFSKKDFVDYCHPSESANYKISKVLLKLMSAKNKNKLFVEGRVHFGLAEDTYTLY